ncbi:MAG: GUN4 domain-containing protein, partial [Cyanobacteria bacterium P01_D01_bin.56]
EQSTPKANSPESSASVRRESISTSNISDQATERDRLGFTPYVEAIAAFLSNEATQPPLTLSIEGGWGSGKSSFMWQLHEELEQIEQRDGKPISRKVWFNAWRHDKVEALWAAFALEFLNQISQPRTRSEILLTWMSYLKLLQKRFNWKENWPDAIRGTALVAFLGSFALALPVLFLNVGWDGINQLSDEIVCRLLPREEEQGEGESGQGDVEQRQNVEGQEQEQKQNSCFELNSSSGNGSDTVVSVLLWLGGFGGSATGALALLVQLKKMLGDPKNDLKQYIEHPDYKNQVAFIEQFHKDFEKVVSAYVGEGNKVYVFIDDLDRCELTKAADLMQGLNLLISNDPSLIFILGMDREKVAAGIALKQKDVLPYLSSPSIVLNQAAQKDQTSLKGLEYGYAYIEKFVQLPFQVPQASEANFKVFLKALPSKPISTTPLTQRKLRFLPSPGWFFRLLLHPKNAWSLYRRTNAAERILLGAEAASAELATLHFNSTSASDLIREPRVEIRLAQDSEAIQQIILKVAPALDYNPRRIKQFINLFRLKVFIAYNTGLFDQLNHGENEENDSNASEAVSQSLTLEQLGKFTALCMLYPLLRIDLEDNHALLANLQRYALNPSWPNSKSDEEESHSADTAKQENYDNTTKYWGSNPKLIQLLRIGLHLHETRQRQDAKQNDDSLELESSNSENYNLEKIDVKKLLQVSSTVEPIDRVPLRSERGVDYRQLRELLRAKRWLKADGETGRIMLKATKRNGLGYFDPLEIEQFSCQDLRTIDQLWVTASGGRFGFSVQKELYVKCGGILDGEYHEEAWNLFCKKNGWQESGKYVPVRYDMKSPVAHLPSQGRRGGFRKTARQEGTGLPSLALKLEKCEITGEF